MALIQTEAIVLNSLRYSETSKILALFTRDQGRLSVLVKGGRKGTKKFPGGLETLNRVEAQFYYKSGRELQNYKASDLLDAYPRLRTDLTFTYTAASLTETVLRSTATEDQNVGLYAALVEGLETLNAAERHPWTVRWRTLLQFCRALGFGLSLEACAHCGAKTPLLNFAASSGGFLCQTCVLQQAEAKSVRGEVWGALRFLNACQPEAASRLIVSPEIGKTIEALFWRYFGFHVSSVKSFASWKELPKLYWTATPE